jgi:spermidine/putrescine transport system substrate-binding protein
MPQSVLDAFTRELGVKVSHVGYQSPEEAADNIRAGGAYDIVVLENQLIPALAKDGLLAAIDYANVPNFRNISAGFRDLAIDPGNRHSVPCAYGTTGLLVRTDLVGRTPTRWADLWDPQYAGRIGLRPAPREIIGLTLASLGHPFNSESPQELDAALERLLALRPSVVMLDVEASDAVPRLLAGEIAVLHGYAEDYQVAREAEPAVAYVLPQEGTALWGDSYAIPAYSPHRRTAEALLNFLLRPDIAAQEINEKKYAHVNDAALPLVDAEIRDDPVIFPTDQDLRRGHIILPLSPEGEQRYAELWARFTAANAGAAP